MQERLAGVTAADRRRALAWVAHGRQPAVRRRCKGGAASSDAVGVPQALEPAPLSAPSVALSALEAFPRAGSRAGRCTARSARP